MRKGLLGLVIILTGVALLTGCSQQIPEVKSSQSAPQNLVVKGIVYSNYFILASGYFDDHRGAPVAGAVVTLNGTYETKTAVTDANGEYVFQNIKNGNYYVTATKEGYQSGTDSIYTTGYYGTASDGTIFTFDIDIYANPVMRSVTPTYNGPIETNATFTIVFNKAMDITTVRPYISAAGLRTMAIGDTVNVTASWDASATILTIIPNNSLLPNMNYTLNLTSGTFSAIKDQSGYGLASSTSSSYGIPVIEDGNVVINQSSGSYFSYKTSSGGTPSAPSSPVLTIGSGAGGKIISSEATIGADYTDIFEAGAMGLSWTTGTGEITGYKVYVSDSATDNFRVLPTTYSINNYLDFTMANILNTIYGTTNIDPLGTANYPMINKPTYFKVTTFNGEGESAPAEISAIDMVGPRLNANVQDSPYAGRVLSNNCYLPALASNKNAYIAFQEPIDPTTVEAANFTIPAVVVNNVTLLTRGSDDLGLFAGNDYSILLIETDTDLTAGGPRTLTVTGVKDLAGNSLVVGTGDTVIIP